MSERTETDPCEGGAPRRPKTWRSWSGAEREHWYESKRLLDVASDAEVRLFAAFGDNPAAQKAFEAYEVAMMEWHLEEEALLQSRLVRYRPDLEDLFAWATEIGTEYHAGLLVPFYELKSTG